MMVVSFSSDELVTVTIKKLSSAFKFITRRNSPVPSAFSTRKTVEMSCCGQGSTLETALLEVRAELPLSSVLSVAPPGLPLVEGTSREEQGQLSR